LIHLGNMENTDGKKTEEAPAAAAASKEEPTVSSDSQPPPPTSTTTAPTTTTTATGNDDAANELPVANNEPPSAAPESGEDLTPESTEVPELSDVALLNSINNRSVLQEMETTELRVKIICLEKNNMALKMEVKCAELQMQAKVKVDVQKTRLVELLDAKVKNLEKKNVHLMDMLEGLLKQKDTHSHRLIDATKHMEALASKLSDSERMRTELRNMNQELKTMLGNIEDKGSQIAKLAKEKIYKYKEEAVQMQLQLDDMKKNAPGGAGTPEGAGAADGERTNRFEQNWKKLEELQLQLTNAFQSESAGDVAESVTKTNTDIKQELEQLRAELNTLLNGNQGENDKLRTALDSMKLLVVDLQQLSQATEAPPTNSAEATKDADAPNDIVAKDLEISQLKEKLGQLNSTITKLADLSVASSVK
jgi:chromosome segregation ATPase